MGNLSNALVILFSLGMILFIAQVSIVQINPTNTNTLFDCRDSIMQRFGECSNTDIYGSTLNTSSDNAILPTTTTTNQDLITVVVQSVANIFDSIGIWLKQTLGLDYLDTAMNTPKFVLTALGVPPFIAWAIGGLVVALVVFFFIDWMKGAFA